MTISVSSKLNDVDNTNCDITGVSGMTYECEMLTSTIFRNLQHMAVPTLQFLKRVKNIFRIYAFTFNRK